jgi:apolipoprotein N-acyltransferase
MTPLLQICSVTGVFGVSFLIVWTSVSLLNGAAVLCSRRREEADPLSRNPSVRLVTSAATKRCCRCWSWP